MAFGRLACHPYQNANRISWPAAPLKGVLIAMLCDVIGLGRSAASAALARANVFASRSMLLSG